MWEYKRKDYSFRNQGELIKMLNEEGVNGWQIIFYEEEPPKSYGEEYKAKVLYKRLKIFPA